MYVGGVWRPVTDDAPTIRVTNPADEQVIAVVTAATEQDVDAAVTAARTALPGWAATPPAERAAHLASLESGLRARVRELAATITAELGAPLALSRMVHVRTPLTVLASYAELTARHPFEERIGNSLVLHEPVGVVGAITPWNYPLHQVISKVAPALAAGCTIVVKPSDLTPLTTRLLTECVAAAGLPDGVFNLVTGGGTAGRALVAHPGVDLVSFTGSTQVGRQVAAVAAGAVKRVALELGGKSANVILPSARLDRAVRAGVSNVFTNSGQTCSTWSRMLVHESRYEEAVALAAEAAAGYAPGDPLDPATLMGPLVDAGQRDRVRACVVRGVEEGHGWSRAAPRRRRDCRRGTSYAPPSSPTSPRTCPSPRTRSSVRCCRSCGTRTRTTPCVSPTGPCTAWPVPCGRPRCPRRWRSPVASTRARSTSTAGASTRWRPSAVTSSPGSAVNSASTD